MPAFPKWWVMTWCMVGHKPVLAVVTQSITRSRVRPFPDHAGSIGLSRTQNAFWFAAVISCLFLGLMEVNGVGHEPSAAQKFLLLCHVTASIRLQPSTEDRWVMVPQSLGTAALCHITSTFQIPFGFKNSLPMQLEGSCRNPQPLCNALDLVKIRLINKTEKNHTNKVSGARLARTKIFLL